TGSISCRVHRPADDINCSLVIGYRCMIHCSSAPSAKCRHYIGVNLCRSVGAHRLSAHQLPIPLHSQLPSIVLNNLFSMQPSSLTKLDYPQSVHCARAFHLALLPSSSPITIINKLMKSVAPLIDFGDSIFAVLF